MGDDSVTVASQAAPRESQEAQVAALAALRYREFDTPFGVLTVVCDPSAAEEVAVSGSSNSAPSQQWPSGPVVASGFGSLSEILGAAGAPAEPEAPTAATALAASETIHAGQTDLIEADLPEIAEALAAYLAGDTAALDRVPVAQSGSPFRVEAWQAMRRIPPGEVRSYAELAADAGRPGAARAAGTACATNGVAPFVPCHRIVRSGGALGKYGYGIDTKTELLRHEGYLRQ